jgi:tetratricopeptide (TPR) repeat protein
VLDIRADTGQPETAFLAVLPERTGPFRFQLDPNRTPPAPRFVAQEDRSAAIPAPPEPEETRSAPLADPGSDPLSRALSAHLDRKRNGGSGIRSNVAASEQRLLAEIARAAGQGLVQPRRTLPSPPSAIPATPPAAEVPPVAILDRGAASQISLTASTAVDRAVRAKLGQGEGAASQVACISDQALSVADWGDDRPFHLQVGSGRAMLYGEFDRINTDAALGLVRTYLHFGFGAEAREVLALLPNPTPEAKILSNMASVMDAPGRQTPSGFDGMAHCDGAAAMWSFLANPLESDPPQDLNAPAIQNAFRALPPHLRAHLGAELGRRFAAAGDEEAASLVLRSVERAPADTAGDLILAQAELAEMNGRDAEAGNLIETAARSDAAVALEALPRKVDRAFQARSSLAPDVPDLIASYLTEHRNGPHGTELRQSLALAHALIGDFRQAGEQVSRVREVDGVEAARIVGAQVLSVATERASDLEFLSLALDAADISVGNFLLQTEIARRFIALNLPDQAETMLAASAFGGLETERRLLRAEVALQRDLPRRALLELLGETGNRAVQLRAVAHARLKDHEAASAYFREAADMPNAERELWLAEDWAGIEAISDPGPYAQSGRALVETVATPDLADERGPLAHGHALLRNSAQTRTQIEDMLRLSEDRVEAGSPGS